MCTIQCTHDVFDICGEEGRIYMWICDTFFFYRRKEMNSILNIKNLNGLLERKSFIYIFNISNKKKKKKKKKGNGLLFKMDLTKPAWVFILFLQ